MRFASRHIIVALATTSFIAACHRDRDTDKGDQDDKAGRTADAALVKRDTTRALGPGDVRVSTVDSSFDVALIGDTVHTGFGKRVLDDVDKKTDTAAVEGKGFAANIEKMVKSTVADAMGHEILFPVSSIQDVRVDDSGRLEFIGNDGKKMHILESSSRNTGVNSTFRPDDAKRFIDAFHARKAR